MYQKKVEKFMVMTGSNGSKTICKKVIFIGERKVAYIKTQTKQSMDQQYGNSFLTKDMDIAKTRLKRVEIDSSP